MREKGQGEGDQWPVLLRACCPQAVHTHEAKNHHVEDEEVWEEQIAPWGLSLEAWLKSMGMADRKGRDGSLPEPAGTEP